MAVDQVARDQLNAIVAFLAKYVDLGFVSEPADYSLAVRNDQPPASGSSQYKWETMTVGTHQLIGRIAGDITALDLSDFSTMAAADVAPTADLLLLRDTDAGQHKAITPDNLLSTNLPVTIHAAGLVGAVTGGGGDTNGRPVLYETTTHALNYWAIDLDTNDAVVATIRMPKSWDGGTLKNPTVGWTTASGSNDVKFEFSAVAIANDGDMDAAYGTAQSVEDTVTTAGDHHETAAMSAVTVAGSPAGGAELHVKLKRTAPAGTDMVGPVRVKWINFEFTTDQHGE